MVLLHLRSSQAEFDAYLLATHGIKKNQFTLNDARATARASGDGWQDLCESWDPGREIETRAKDASVRWRIELRRNFFGHRSEDLDLLGQWRLAS